LLRLRGAWKRVSQALQGWLRENSYSPRWLPEFLRHPASGYFVALLIEALAVLGSFLLIQWCPEFAFRCLLPVLAIILVALTWGAWRGLLATFWAAFLLDRFILPPPLAWDNGGGNDTVSLLLFLLAGVAISLIAGQSNRARCRAEEMARSLSEEQARTERERLRLRTMLDFLPAAVGMVDAEGTYLEITPACKSLWGEQTPRPRTIADFEGAKAWWPGTGQRLAVKEWGMTQAVTRGEVVTNKEVEIETADGERKIVLDSATPIHDETGTIIGAVGILQDITELKRLEQALRQSEREAAARANQLEAIFEAMTESVVVFDKHERVLQRNAADRQLFDFDMEPETLAERRNIIRLRDVHGQPIPRERASTVRALQGHLLNDPTAPDVIVSTSTQGDRLLNVTAAPIRDADGHVSGGVMVMRDVTERRRMEREMAERAALLETIFESITDGLIVTDARGNILRLNRAGKALLNIQEDPTALSMPSLEVLAGFVALNTQQQPLAEAERPINRYLQGEVLTKQKSVDLIIQTRSGQTLVNNSGGPIRDASGRIIGAVEIIRDVTEQRRLEAHTRHTLDALVSMAEALVQEHDELTHHDGLNGHHPTQPRTDPAMAMVAQRLAELTHSVLGCQYVGIVAVEPETEALTPITIVGLAPEQERLWWEQWNGLLHLGQRLSPTIIRALQAGEPILFENTNVPHPLWQDFSPGHNSIIVPMRVGETLVGVLRVDCGIELEDFTCPNRRALVMAVARLGALVLERERLLRERAEARASELALREAKTKMDTFLGMAGHELKTPLTSIKLSLQLAERRFQQISRRDPTIASELAPFLEQSTRAEWQTERLERLVNDLLDVSRIQAGKLELRPEATDLAAIVREAVEEQRRAEPGRALIVHFPDDLRVPVTADADRIGQVVTNYLTNALKYSPEESSVEVGIASEDHHVRVWVRDEGPGLSAAEKEHIWERFYRVKGIEVQSGSGIGLGLGLHICSTIIERHQGQVGVESVPGKGSTFWFSLPLVAAAISQR
jgi:PAS domain S-box-containing protein